MRYWPILLFFHLAKVLCVPQPIVGGKNAAPFTFGYQVSLRYPKENQTYPWHFCGGSIISNRHILTAAHCSDIVKKPNRDLLKVIVCVGALFLRPPGPLLGECYGIQSFKIHEKFEPQFLANDIAVITTNTPIKFFTNGAWPISLSYSRPPDGQFVTCTGWGFIRTDPFQIPNRLQVINTLQVLNLQRCKQLNPERPDFRYKLVTDSNICLIGDKGHATCQGDSGGPVVYNNRQFALVSFGSVDCANSKRIALTFLGAYMQWIYSNTGLLFV